MIFSDKQYFDITKKRAIRSFITFVLGLLILLGLEMTNLDRKTRSDIISFVFWPLYFYSLYQSVLVFIFYLKKPKSFAAIYLVMIIPAFLFLIYSIYEIVRTINNG